MHSRKKHDKASKSAKEAGIQLSGLSLLIYQDKVRHSHKIKQSPSKSSSKTQPSKASPRRRPQTRTDDLRTSPYTCCRHQSPSPSRGSSRTSLSPVSVTEGLVKTIADDGATSSVSSSPGNSGPSYGRYQWLPTKKVSSRSRHSETQAGKPKVTVSDVTNGKVFVRRTQEERSYDPDRLAMDKCGLTACPIIEGEDQLRLLNLKNNEIRKIENMLQFSFLMFLDMSDNYVERIMCLESLVSLRVLMLARNRIRYIEGLECLVHLDVLDLSGNEIEEISNVNHLHELRVLNLSNNQLRRLGCLKGLDFLIELNLNKNFISNLADVDNVPRLQRLFLAQNSIERFEDMACIVNVPSLTELSLEGCPVTQRPHYRYFILFRMWQLKFLDMRRVLDEEKRTAQIVMRKEEVKRQEIIRMAKIKEAREKAIDNARTLWETNDKILVGFSDVPGQDRDNVFPPTSAVPLQLLATRSISFSEEEEDCSLCEGSGLPCDFCNGSRQKNICCRTGVKPSRSKQKHAKRSHESLKARKSKISSPLELELADSNLTYLAEIEEHTLQLYGPGAVAAALSHPWHPNTVGVIQNMCFHFIVFDSISHLLNKMKAQFPNVTAVTFECTNLQMLPQLNALGQMPGLHSVTLESEGNPLVDLALWRPYIIYRLGPSVAFINSSPVTELERVKAEEMFEGVCSTLLSLLPKYRLSSLLNSPRVKQVFLSEKGYSPNSLQGQADNQVSSEVVKAALTYNPDSESKSAGYCFAGKKILERTVTNVDETVRKRVVFQQHWSSIFFGMVNDALEDFTDINRHMKLSMQILLKKYKLLNDNICYY